MKGSGDEEKGKCQEKIDDRDTDVSIDSSSEDEDKN